MIVIARVGVAVEPIISQICRNLSFGVPQTRSTISGRVARVVLLHQVEDAARMRERRIRPHESVLAELVVPARLVVAALLRVVAGVHAVRERELLLHDEGRVGVVRDVLALDLVVASAGS